MAELRAAMRLALMLAVTLSAGRSARAAIVLNEEMAELAKMLRDSCGAETGADLALVERVNAGAELAQVPEPTLKCYIKCVMETAGMMADGVMDVEAVLALMPDELRLRHGPGLRHCGTQRGDDHCDTAYRTQICWQRAIGDDYFLI